MGRLRTLQNRVAVLDTRKAKPPHKRAAAFYLSREWRSLVASLMAQRGRRCEDPECKMRGREGIRIFGDHIKELQDGGAPLDPDNVLLRCGSCHTRKTSEERKKRQEG